MQHEVEARNLRVLVVEDNRIAQMCATRMLETYGFIAEGADNGRVAIDKLTAAPASYALILMDLRMPVMDGLECTGAIRRELNLDTPIVAFTAECSREIKQQCFDLGMNGFLSKPASHQGIVHEVGKLLNIKLKLKEAVKTPARLRAKAAGL